MAILCSCIGLDRYLWLVCLCLGGVGLSLQSGLCCVAHYCSVWVYLLLWHTQSDHTTSLLADWVLSIPCGYQVFPQSSWRESKSIHFYFVQVRKNVVWCGMFVHNNTSTLWTVIIMLSCLHSHAGMLEQSQCCFLHHTSLKVQFKFQTEEWGQ